MGSELLWENQQDGWGGGGFRAPPPPLRTQIRVKEFSDLCNLKALIKERTCFKNPEKLTCFDLMLTNSYIEVFISHVQ